MTAQQQLWEKQIIVFSRNLPSEGKWKTASQQGISLSRSNVSATKSFRHAHLDAAPLKNKSSPRPTWRFPGTSEPHTLQWPCHIFLGHKMQHPGASKVQSGWLTCHLTACLHTVEVSLQHLLFMAEHHPWLLLVRDLNHRALFYNKHHSSWLCSASPFQVSAPIIS